MSWQVLIFVSIITYSVAVLLQRVLLRGENSHPIAFALLFQLLVGLLIGLALIYPAEIKFLRSFLKPKKFLIMLTLVLIFSVASITFFGALQAGSNSSQIIVVNLTNVLLTVILALVFLKETDRWLGKILGALVAFLGLVLVV